MMSVASTLPFTGMYASKVPRCWNTQTKLDPWKYTFSHLRLNLESITDYFVVASIIGIASPSVDTPAVPRCSGPREKEKESGYHARTDIPLVQLPATLCCLTTWQLLCARLACCNADVVHMML